MRVLSNIEQEVKQYGEPANPGLGRAVAEARSTLSVGGAIVGFRGMGKTLLASLSALAMGRATVVDVAKLLTVEGKVELGEISNCGELNETGGSLAKWLGGSAQKVNCNEEVEVAWARFERLKGLLRRLGELRITPILDGFEDIILHPEAYGYAIPRLIEDFFSLVDARPVPFGLALPAELWARFDLQIKSRIAPTYFIRWGAGEMKQFLRRLCQCALGPLEQVEFKNPKAVVAIAEELKRHAPEEVVEKRFEELRIIAEEVAPRSADVLFEILKELWTRQNIYAEVQLRKRSRLLVRGLAGYSLDEKIIEKIRAYVYGREDLHHLIYELLL